MNSLIDLACGLGYEAYHATYDGTYPEWLIQHAPHCSLAQVRQWKEAGRPMIYFTCWLGSPAFLEIADEFYLYDCEITHTASPSRHLELFQRLMPRIKGIATLSRLQQIWHMATFGYEPTVLSPACDTKYWHANASKREPGLIGYMQESPNPYFPKAPSTEEHIADIAHRCKEAGVQADFIEITGDHQRIILDTMQRCDLFLGMNPGKHRLWGESGPLPPLEAMHAGAVVVSYNVHGALEDYTIDGYNGFLVPRGRPDLMAERVIWLMQHPRERWHMRFASQSLASSAFSLEAQGQALRKWLELGEE